MQGCPLRLPGSIVIKSEYFMYVLITLRRSYATVNLNESLQKVWGGTRNGYSPSSAFGKSNIGSGSRPSFVRTCPTRFISVIRVRK